MYLIQREACLAQLEQAASIISQALFGYLEDKSFSFADVAGASLGNRTGFYSQFALCFEEMLHDGKSWRVRGVFPPPDAGNIPDPTEWRVELLEDGPGAEIRIVPLSNLLGQKGAINCATIISRHVAWITLAFMEGNYLVVPGEKPIHPELPESLADLQRLQRRVAVNFTTPYIHSLRKRGVDNALIVEVVEMFQAADRLSETITGNTYPLSKRLPYDYMMAALRRACTVCAGLSVTHATIRSSGDGWRTEEEELLVWTIGLARRVNALLETVSQAADHFSLAIAMDAAASAAIAIGNALVYMRPVPHLADKTVITKTAALLVNDKRERFDPARFAHLNVQNHNRLSYISEALPGTRLTTDHVCAPLFALTERVLMAEETGEDRAILQVQASLGLTGLEAYSAAWYALEAIGQAL